MELKKFLFGMRTAKNRFYTAMKKQEIQRKLPI